MLNSTRVQWQHIQTGSHSAWRQQVAAHNTKQTQAISSAAAAETRAQSSPEEQEIAVEHERPQSAEEQLLHEDDVRGGAREARSERPQPRAHREAAHDGRRDARDAPKVRRRRRKVVRPDVLGDDDARRWRTSDVTLQTLRSNALRLYRYKSPPKKFVFVFVFAMHVFQLLCDDV